MATKLGGRTLEQTMEKLGVKGEFDAIDFNVERDAARRASSFASTQFVQNARGIVRVYVGNNVSEGGVFLNDELPALKDRIANGFVTKVEWYDLNGKAIRMPPKFR